MHRLERRRFLGDLLTAIPTLRLGTLGVSLASLGYERQPARTAGVTGGLQGHPGGIIVAAGEDRFHVKRGVGVSSTTFKVSSGDTQRSLFAMEQANDPAKHGGPPLHLHKEADELWYVLAGEYVIEVNGEQFRARPGDCVLGPR